MKRQSLITSRFPIFDKLKLIEQRAQTIVEHFEIVYGWKARSISKKQLLKIQSSRQAVIRKRKSKDRTATFEFLGRQLDQAKIEEAKLIRALLEKYGHDTVKLMTAASYEFGKKLGLGVPLENDLLLEDRHEIKKFLRFWFCDFVSCESGFHPCFETCQKFLVRHDDCPHRASWDKAKAPSEVMCQIHSYFLKGLIEAISAHRVEVKVCRSRRGKDLLFDESYQLL